MGLIISLNDRGDDTLADGARIIVIGRVESKLWLIEVAEVAQRGTPFSSSSKKI